MLTKDDDVKIKQINLTAQQINNNAQQLIEKCGKKNICQNYDSESKWECVTLRVTCDKQN